MSKKFSRWLLVLFCGLVAILSGCSGGSGDASKGAARNSFVESISNDRISRYASFVINLTQAIPEGKQSLVNEGKAAKISGDVEGGFYYDAERSSIVFRPDGGFAANSSYTITIDIASLFPDVAKEDRLFQCTFSTLPLRIMGYLGTCEANAENDDNYDISMVFNTADLVEGGDFEKLIVFSEPADATWSHSADGRTHSLSAMVSMGDSERTFVVSCKADAEAGLDAKVLTSCAVPAKGSMRLVSVMVNSEDASRVDVSFSKVLDPKQKVKGLVYIVDNENQSVDTEGSRIMLYPDRGRTGEIAVKISGAVRSRNGYTLGRDTTVVVSVDALKPAVQFLRGGTVVPASDKVVVPFRTVYMRAVELRVFKIFANKMGQFLQQNDLNGTSQLRYVSRPIAVKTLVVPENASMTHWCNQGIDLSDVVAAEPGALYRLELRMDKANSAWPGASTSENVHFNDQSTLNSLINKYNSAPSYYYDDDDEWYPWDEREDPLKSAYYGCRSVRRNVLATDIAMTILSTHSDNGEAYKFITTSLSNSSVLPDVTLTGYNLQGQAVCNVATDGLGMATLPFKTNAGTVFYVKATRGNDVSYMRVQPNESLSTSTFDVSGCAVNNGLKGFIYGERGVWRPGDTLHISFAVQDLTNSLPEDHPVSLEVYNARNNKVFDQTKKSSTYGLTSFHVPTNNNDATGTWEARVRVGGSVFYKNLRIETVKPNRLKIDLDVPSVILAGAGASASLHSEWLTGAKAPSLKYDVRAALCRKSTSFNGFDGYRFDDNSIVFDPEDIAVDKSTTDEMGDARVNLNFAVNQSAPGLLRCRLTTRVYEASGEYSSDNCFVDYSPFTRYVGVKSPQKDDTPLATNKDHVFSVACVTQDGRPVSNASVSVEVFKVSYYWWWSARDGSLASFSSDNLENRVQSLTVRTDAKGIAEFKVNRDYYQWGTYFIRVSDKGGNHSASTFAYFDWPEYTTKRRGDQNGQAATSLKIATDKNEYNVGDDIKLTFPSAAGGHAIVSLTRGDVVLSSQIVNADDQFTTVTLKATEDMMPNAYAVVSLLQPYEKSNDRPIRMYGVVNVPVVSASSRLHPVITMPDEIAPNKVCEVAVSEQDGRQMSYTLAIVDEGLLDLTHFRTPNAWDEFFAREAFGVKIWDIFGHVAGAYGGKIEQLFSVGGDEGLMNGEKSTVNRFEPMVRFVGPFTLEKGKTNKHKIDVPNYIGRVRAMVVGTSGNAYGNTEKSVVVNRPLVALATMPRQIGVDDEATISATIFASGKSLKKAGASEIVDVTISATGGVKVVGDAKKSITFTSEGNKTINFRVKALPHSAGAETGTITISASGIGDKYTTSTTLAVRSVGQTLAKTTNVVIEGGKEWSSQTANLLPEGIGAQDARATVELSVFGRVRLDGRMKYLVGYPHGCLEQTTSRSLAQVYLPLFSDLSKPQVAECEKNVKAGIERLNSFMTSSDGCAYWPGLSSPNLRYSAYARIFLAEAESRGFFVPSHLKYKLDNYLANQVGNWRTTDVSYYSSDVAFALMALAYTGNASLNNMNRMNEVASKLPDDALVSLATAFHFVGRKDVAKQVLAKVSAGNLYGAAKSLRVCLLADDPSGVKELSALTERLSSDDWMSTWDVSTSLFAIRTFLKSHEGSTDIVATVIGDRKETARTAKLLWSSESALNAQKGLGLAGSATIKNNGKGSLFASVTTYGEAVQADIEAERNGLNVTVSYVNENGTPCTDLSHARQGERIKAKVSVENLSNADVENIAITHILPSGCEPSDVKVGYEFSYYDVRDDRVLSYIDKLRPGRSATVEVMIMMTYAGEFYQPSIHAEAMYDASICGWTSSGHCVIE